MQLYFMHISLNKKQLVFVEKSSRGFSLLEVVIAVSILLTIFISLIAAYNYFIKVSINNVPLVKSAYLIEEGVEAAKILRDTSWSTKIAPLSPGVSYYLVFDGTTFNTTQAQNVIDGMYYRTLSISPVSRDANGDIQATGTNDSNTKKITVTVSWYNGSATTTKQLSAYITNLFNN